MVKTKLVVVVLNGWGASSRRKETRTAELVMKITKGLVNEDEILTKRAMLAMSRVRRFRKFILRHQSPDRSLLVVGKSLGAKNLVSGVLNNLPDDLTYKRTGLVTIDPCWPEQWDWTPNLNKRSLYLCRKMGRAVNLMAIRPPDKQAGSMLRGPGVYNIQLTGYSHVSIVEAPEVEHEIQSMVDWLVWSFS